MLGGNRKLSFTILPSQIIRRCGVHAYMARRRANLSEYTVRHNSAVLFPQAPDKIKGHRPIVIGWGAVRVEMSCL